jgi:outer membrane protein OmpA-like peptidoglycan-associated protein
MPRALLLLALFAPGSAFAQALGGQRFLPALSEDGVLGTDGADPRVPLRPTFSLWIDYALNPIVLDDEANDQRFPIIQHALGANLTGSINLWQGLEVGVGVPFRFLTLGDEEAADRAGLRIRTVALGNIRIDVGYRLSITAEDHLALQLPLLLPGAPNDDPLGFGLAFLPTLAYVHGFEPLDLLLNVSVLVRGATDRLDLESGSELGLRLGSRIPIEKTWTTNVLVDLGLSTSLRDPFSAAGTPFELRAGVEHWFALNWRLTGFLGMGFSTGVGAPDFRAGVAITFGERPRRPRREGDWDGDGLSDETDGCPYDPEDLDGFEDTDGCPDFDNDKDGVPDVSDSCPMEPETQDGIADDDGCPDHIRVRGSFIETFEPIHFKTDSEEILPQSFPLLREIAGVMKVNPALQISVQGHTDSTGDDGYNLDLSQRRADSVKKFLIENGVDGGRISAKGYGETKPIDSNETEEGRFRNRRVEFHLDQ